ncbi:MAG: MotA/TolQ/ExbB proton channel family protein [Victivallaceae bacterium]
MLFLNLMKDGGPVMWLILLASLIAMYVFLEKWFQFHRDQIKVEELIKGLTNVLRRDGFIEALSLCDHTPGPAARVLTAMILACERGDRRLEIAAEDAALTEVPKLERNLSILGTIGYVAPLLGLFGTVLGMIQLFQTVAEVQSTHLTSTMLSSSLNMALLTTAAGLAVAIPCYVAYNYLVSRVDAMTLDMEKAAREMLKFFAGHAKAAATHPETAEEQQE